MNKKLGSHGPTADPKQEWGQVRSAFKATHASRAFANAFLKLIDYDKVATFSPVAAKGEAHASDHEGSSQLAGVQIIG